MSVQNSNLNSKQISEAKRFLHSLSPIAYCGLNADGSKGCGRVESKIKQDWFDEQRRKGNPNPKRTKPFLIINEKQGRGLHRKLNGKFDYCGNICYYCYTCNAILDKGTKSLIVPDDEDTYTSRKSRAVRPKFKRELVNHLIKFKEICYMGCINKWSGLEDYDCSQETLRNAFNQILDVKVILVDKDEYGFDCNYPKCNSEHIIHANPKYQPLPIKSDKNAHDEELINEVTKL